MSPNLPPARLSTLHQKLSSFNPNFLTLYLRVSKKLRCRRTMPFTVDVTLTENFAETGLAIKITNIWEIHLCIIISSNTTLKSKILIIFNKHPS